MPRLPIASRTCKRRYADGSDDPAGSITSQTNRGFTGHEELADVGLVHMNGRVYDPLLARFGTPDPMTESPFSTQGWNRYSYVGNSPLNFTDPTGYCFLGCFWKPIFKAVGNFFKQAWGSILQVAAAAICTPAGLGPVCAAAASAFVAGVTSGNLGAALKAGLITAVTAGAFYVVGTETAGSFPANVAGHAAVGCLSAVASGGKCGAGALSAGVSAIGTPLINDAFPNAKGDMSHMLGGTVGSSVLGGIGSVAGGGKFANGAVTAAFGYLFNNALHRDADPRDYDPNDPNYHRYELESFMCRQSAPVCTEANVFRAARLFPTPTTFSDVPINTYDQSNIFGVAGTVTHYVFPSDLTFYNVTDPGHVLDPGYVMRSVVSHDGGIYILSIGEGTGAFAGVNSALGPGACLSP